MPKESFGWEPPLVLLEGNTEATRIVEAWVAFYRFGDRVGLEQAGILPHGKD